MKTRLVMAALAFGALAARGQTPDDHARFEAAQSLQREGREQEAFLSFLSIPGGEHAAITLARPRAKEFLEILRRGKNTAPTPRAWLVEADLVLALGRKVEARQLYHKLAAHGPGENWDTELADYYPVEPPQSGDDLDQT